MTKQSTLACSVALALALPGAASAEGGMKGFFESLEYYGYLKNETAVYLKSGQVTGQERTTLSDNEKDAGEVMKFENSARLFLNGEFGEESSWHLDFNIIYDTEGVKDHYEGHRIYSQHDWLREAYVDTALGPVEFRLGKQQIVWGTADGIKLLDIINPTDFREFNQNTFEDSRIPLWMGKAELPVGEAGNMQFVASQARTNRIPGLTFSWDDRGHPFIAKGVDTITGRVNGFFQINPALGSVANAFSQIGQGFGAPGTAPFFQATVEQFATGNLQGQAAGFGAVCGVFLSDPTQTGISSAPCLKAISEAPSTAFDDALNAAPWPFPTNTFQNTGGDNRFVTNVIDATFQGQWSSSENRANSAFEFFPEATFATFNSLANVSSVRDKKTPDDFNLNYGFRWKHNFKDTINYSLNYYYAYDQNPNIRLQWRDPATGEKLRTELLKASQTGIFYDPSQPDNETVLLKNSAGESYGRFEGDPRKPTFGMPLGTGGSGRPAELVFKQRWNRIHNIGGSFDYSFGLGKLLANPLVLRGEALYQIDTAQPVIDRGELAIGNVTEGLLSEKQDHFKYVLGLDFLVWTNLTISTQFIQFINLDYKNKDSRVPGFKRYTGDAPVLHVDNSFQRAKEYKEFYTLFLSKPFGPSQLGRVNNIFLYEENGGYWNRLDVEYQFTDELVASAELNAYWGDNDGSWFGQFDDSTNFQVGLKYIFE